MAKAARIDKVTFGGKDAPFCTVAFTGGESPLPAAPEGRSMLFQTEEDFVAALVDVEARISVEDLALLQVAVAYKADPRFGATFSSKCVSKVAMIDLTGQATAISIG